MFAELTSDLLPPDVPNNLEPEVDEPSDLSDLEFPEAPYTSEDDACWEAFIPDDDQWDPQPEPGDFWIEDCLRAAA